MYLKVIYVVLFGFVVDDASAAKDKFHIKIQVPEVVNHHHHTKFVLFEDDDKPQNLKDPGVEYDFDKSNPFGEGPYEDGYKKSWKSVRTEKYETETLDNPHSSYPGNQYIVKEKVQVKEKLPYLDFPIEYDHEYEYPSSGGDYHNSEKLIDLNNAKTDPFSKEYESAKIIVDPFSGADYEAPKKKVEKKVKSNPKQYNYVYKYPSNDYEYAKNVKIIDSYIKGTPDSGALQVKPKKSEDYGYNEVSHDVPKFERVKASEFDRLGPSEEDSYHNYKTDGPSFNNYF